MDFKDKKVLIMGLGLHGGGRAAAAWFTRHGANVIVTDIQSEKELRPSLDALKSLPSIQFHLGGHREEDFDDADMIIQNPGVPRESPFLTRARQRGIPIENEATIFFELSKHTPKICVTGTRGKSTTTALIGAMISDANRAAIVAGIASRNGSVALLDVLDHAIANEEMNTIVPAVLELSSWQLELFRGRDFSPAIAVVTNVFPDHLNRYISFDEYAAAKSLIFLSQKETDAVVFNYDNATTLQWGLSQSRQSRYWFTRGVSAIDRGACIEAVDDTTMIVWKDGGSTEAIMPVRDLLIRGNHSCENALAAVCAAKIFGVSNVAIARVLRTFQGLPDRLEAVSRVGGRTWINDTAATTPDATQAALASIPDTRIILIAGGADKKLDYSSLASQIAGRVSALILFSGTATPHIVASLKSAGSSVPISMANSMTEAVRLAWKQSAKGDTILLSPAAASFGMFSHEFDRGRRYIQAINGAQEVL